jgi:hypothetical protein
MTNLFSATSRLRLPHRLVVAAATAAACLLPLPAAAADGCRLIDSLPVTIKEPGRYCLVRDFETDFSGGPAIEVEADRVTIDLQGHAIDNTRVGPNYASGVFSWERSHVAVRNGSLAGFRWGIALSGPFGTDAGYHLVEEMRISESTSSGIGIVGNDSIVRGNTVVRTLSPNPKESAQAISLAGWRHRALDNDIAIVGGGALEDVAIVFFVGGNHMAFGNRISHADVAVSFYGVTGQYRDNVANEMSGSGQNAYQGGTDLGGNSAF